MNHSLVVKLISKADSRLRHHEPRIRQAGAIAGVWTISLVNERSGDVIRARIGNGWDQSWKRHEPH